MLTIQTVNMAQSFKEYYLQVIHQASVFCQIVRNIWDLTWQAWSWGKNSSPFLVMTALSEIWRAGTGSRLREVPSPYPVLEQWQIPGWIKYFSKLFCWCSFQLRGKVVAGYRKKLLSLYATAYITIDMNGRHIQLYQALFC